jgi:hypothetical protein
VGECGARGGLRTAPSEPVEWPAESCQGGLRFGSGPAIIATPRENCLWTVDAVDQVFRQRGAISIAATISKKEAKGS